MHLPLISFVSSSKYKIGLISSVVSGSIIVIVLFKFGVYWKSLCSVSSSFYMFLNLNGIGFFKISTLLPSNTPLFITTFSFPKERIAKKFPSGFGSSI